jgi:hypothetical protein
MEAVTRQRGGPRQPPKPRGKLPNPKEKAKAHPISKVELRSLVLALSRKQPWMKRTAEQRLETTRHFQETTLNSLQVERLDCPICIDTMVDPVLLSCGHGYCQKCIAESVFIQRRCPVCRHSLAPDELDLFVSPAVHRLIEAYL